MGSVPTLLRAPPPLASWWSAKSPGERRLVAGTAALAVALVGWLLVWQPLVRDIAALRTANARGAVALAETRRMADDLAGLARTTAPAAPGDPRADFERVVAQRGLRAALAQQEWKEGRLNVAFNAVAFDALVGTLEALQREARLRVVSATIAARVEPGAVRAELVLAR
ncbi:MAG TPA: type II secretion system protein GspM [Casimicrobiaceae bacterium]|nr:type II secretion system protein GspM [Casimicrobiaceae bacterium]